MICWFVLRTIYADRAFESCKSELNEQGITLSCCDTNSHMLFIERTIRFVKKRVRCVQSMLPKRIKRVPARLMRELVISTVKMINFIRGKGGVHPIMSPRLIVTSYIYGVKDGTTNSINNMRTFPALYLRPNDEGGKHFVYNIHTM